MKNLTINNNIKSSQFFLQGIRIKQITSPIQNEYNGKQLQQLTKDTVSFKGCVLKKSDFQGTDLAVIEKFKPNIQQFKKKEDLQTFSERKINELKEKDFGGRQEATRMQRKNMLKEWFEYVIKENEAYTNTQRLIILASITKDLKPNNDTIPPVLDKGVLADTIAELEERLKNNPKENFDFNKIYQNNLMSSVLNDFSTKETITGWIVIPSKTNDPDNFEKNVEKLKTLSHPKWCIKSFNAEPYLSQGNIHIYLEKGKPKLCVRLKGDTVEEIQGEKNDNKIPNKYLSVFNEYKETNKFDFSINAQNEIKSAERKKKTIEKIISDLKPYLKLTSEDNALQILKYWNIKAQQTEKGLVLSEYKTYLDDVNFEDININENKIFKYVHEITGDASFKNTTLSNLGNLQRIGGEAIFTGTEIESLAKLEVIEGDAYFEHSNVRNTGNLRRIGGNVNFGISKIKNLGNIEIIGGDANFENSIINSLGNLKKIEGNAKFGFSQIKSTNKLEYIGKDAIFSHSNIEDINSLKYIGGNTYIKYANNLTKPDFSEIETNGEIKESEAPPIILNYYPHLLD